MLSSAARLPCLPADSRFLPRYSANWALAFSAAVSCSSFAVSVYSIPSSAMGSFPQVDSQLGQLGRQRDDPRLRAAENLRAAVADAPLIRCQVGQHAQIERSQVQAGLRGL